MDSEHPEESGRKSIYGDHLAELENIRKELMERVDRLRTRIREETGYDPIEHCLSRIKSEESMREKCVRKGLPQTEESALFKIHDAIGMRIVCAFLNDVYMVRDYLLGFEDIQIVQEKDYIKNAKPGGYRSLHLIIKMESGYYAEIQIRTISMDTWAVLEHQLTYKKNISGSKELIASELKRCADELASTDLSLQTIKDMINGDI